MLEINMIDFDCSVYASLFQIAPLTLRQLGFIFHSRARQDQ